MPHVQLCKLKSRNSLNLAFNLNTLYLTSILFTWLKFTCVKGAMSRPAHPQDFCLLCWFSQLSAILDLGNQADFWQQTSVYSTFTVQFLLVYLSIFFVKFYCGYRRETMISDEATESVEIHPNVTYVFVRVALNLTILPLYLQHFLSVE